MKILFVLLLMVSLYCQSLAQNHNSNYLDSLNETRDKILWIVHFSDSKSVTTYNLIYLHKNVDSTHCQTWREQDKFHPLALGVVDVYPKKNIKFLNLKELCLIYKISHKKMDLPIYVDEEMIVDPKDIIVDGSNIKSLKIEHNKEIDKDVIQINTITETLEAKYKKEVDKYKKEHPNEIYWVR